MTENTTPIATEEVKCYLVKTADGVAIRDLDGNISENATITKDGFCYKLPKNDANRQWYMIAKSEKDFETYPDGIPLVYKASKKFGPQKRKIPNENILPFLSEEDRAEYLAIINRAFDRMDADKKQPLTEEDKLRKKIADAEAKLAELLALQSADTPAD